MRKGFFIVVVFTLMLAGQKCTNSAQGPQYFSTKDGLVELQFPAGWFVNEKENPYDLQCFSKDQSLNTGIFLYRMQDLASDLNAQQLLRLQVADIQSKRENFYTLEPQAASYDGGKTLTTEVYSGEKDQSTYTYKFTLIEFSENSDIVLVALQVAFPSSWDTDRPILDGILRSARIKS